MSISIMSLVFYAEIPDLQMSRTKKKKDGDTTEIIEKLEKQTAKIILLAYADHANDEGESAYPSLRRLEVKSGLTRAGVSKAIRILKHNNFLILEGEKKKTRTNEYTINISVLRALQNGQFSPFKKMIDSKPGLLSDGKPGLLSDSKPHLPESSFKSSSKPSIIAGETPETETETQQPVSHQKKNNHPFCQIAQHHHRLSVPIVLRDAVIKAAGDDPNDPDSWLPSIPKNGRALDEMAYKTACSENVVLRNWNMINYKWIAKGFKPQNFDAILENWEKGNYTLERRNGNNKQFLGQKHQDDKPTQAQLDEAREAYKKSQAQIEARRLAQSESGIEVP